MADPDKARAVSGEMMASARPQAAGVLTHGDIVDAEFIEIAVDPKVGKQPEPAASAPLGMSILDKSAQRPPARQMAKAGPVFWLFGVVAAVAAFWVSGGHALVRQNPTMKTEAIAAQFRIGAVHSQAVSIEGSLALIVDGDVSNQGKAGGVLPPLVLSVISTGGSTTLYRLGTSAEPLQPGAKYHFSSRLDMPKDGVKTVSVSLDQ